MEPSDTPLDGNEKKKNRKLSFKNIKNTFGRTSESNSRNLHLLQREEYIEDDMCCTCSTQRNTNQNKLLSSIKSMKKAFCRFCKTKQRITSSESLRSSSESWTGCTESENLPPVVPPRCTSVVYEDPLQMRNQTNANAKRSLTEELFNLAKYGWYWGPVTGSEVEEKLNNLPDGSFLVRDSSSDNYLLTVSFRSAGKTLHTRIEHNFGFFSFNCQEDRPKFISIPELINHSMNVSEEAVFCYSRPRSPTDPSFPVRLTKPVSRFTHVRSLQYLCRFVIRQYTHVDNIEKLPLPKPIQGYVQQGHY